MFKRSLILSLSFACFANSFCMDQSNFHKAQSKTNNAIHALARYGKVLKKEYSLDALPDEVLLNIFKYCAESMPDEVFLAKMFRRLALTNKRFNLLLQDKVIVLDFFNTLEKIKQKYYKRWNCIYTPIQNTLKESCIELLSKNNLIEEVTFFANNKKNNLDMIISSKDKVNLLFEVTKKGPLDIIVLALDNGVHIESREKNNETALMCSAFNCNIPAVKLLIKKGASLNIRSASGRTPLMLAGNAKIAEILLQAGADINDKMDNGTTVLMRHIEKERFEVAEFLLNKGANINERNDAWWTALMMAAKYNSQKLVNALLDQGTLLEEKNNSGETALYIAVLNNNLWIVEILINRGARIDVQDNRGVTPLMCAARSGMVNIIKKLLANGADLEARNSAEETAIFFASRDNKIDTIKCLIDAGAQINIQNDLGRTPLMIAVDYNNKDAVIMLLEHNAEIFAQDLQYKTAWDIANERNESDIINAFKNRTLLGKAELFIKQIYPSEETVRSTLESLVTFGTLGAFYYVFFKL